MAEVAEAISQNPELQRQLDQYRKQKEALRALYAPVLDESVPDDMVALLRRDDKKRHGGSC